MGILDKVLQGRPLESTTNPATGRSPLDKMAPPNTRPHDWQISARKPLGYQGRMRPPVGSSEDLKRVLALPRRAVPDLDDSSSATTGAMIELMSRRLAYDNPSCTCEATHGYCIRSLRPAQAWALYEMALVGGLLGPIGVGHGKTGLDILSAMVMPNTRTAVLLIPPGLYQQVVLAFGMWAQHFKVPNLILEQSTTLSQKGRGFIPGRPSLHVVPFSKFSRPESTALLESLRPDLVIADEGHKLRYANTSTTSRVIRYMVAHPETRFLTWSGTLTKGSIKDYAHLSTFALAAGSPLPNDPDTVDEWALAIDPSNWQADMGSLVELCEPGETLYKAYHRRLSETRGVVATKAGAIDASIIIHERKVPNMPERLKELLDVVRKDKIRPDGEELVDILAITKAAREVACGFFYRWKYPKGEPEELILEWLAIRKAWHRELRNKLEYRAEHLDSPLLCAKAAIRYYQEAPPPLGIGKAYDGPLPMWPALEWPEWHRIRGQVEPEPEAVWLDDASKLGAAGAIPGADYLARDAAAWLKEHRGIVWYEHEAFGRRVAELSGCPLHAGGPGAEERILAERGDRSLVVSIKAHGTGRDGLQRLFNKQYIANLPASGDLMEQLLGRLHRIGLDADEVETWIPRHTVEMRDAWDRAMSQARYIEGTMGTKQKLLSATLTFEVTR